MAAAAPGLGFEHSDFQDMMGPAHLIEAHHPEHGPVGYAEIREKKGPGAPHVEISRLWTTREHRGTGIGSALLGEAERHYEGREMRLKPWPEDDEVEEDDPDYQDEGDLRRYYQNRGFRDIPGSEYMTRQAAGYHEEEEDEPYDACYYCQREHNPHEHEEQQSFVPEWDQVLTGIHSIHRVLPLQLQEREHALVHDPATPPEHAAGTILKHIAETHADKGHMHWTSQEGLEHSKATFGGMGRGTTSVVLHARTPDEGDIDDDASSLIENQVHPYGHPEYEVPIAPGADVHLTGVSWAHARTGGWGKDNRWHEGPAQEWHHHGFRQPMRVEAAGRWQPSTGIFGPTTGLDQRLFGPGGELRPEVREAIMARLDQALRVDSGLAGSDWQQWLRVYLAGGSASEWAGNRPNEAAQDLDVLLGVDYGAARASSPALSRMDDAQVDAALNAALRSGFNESGWTPGFGGTWDLTGYVNHAAFDVRAIKPYAAYNVSGGHWAVRPPHLPSHSLADFDPAVLAQARALASEARAILRMPEPLRTREARALWERIHAERSQAFSDAGEGWTDPGNVAEKWLAYAPGELLRRIRELALADSGTKTAFLANVEAMGESAAHEPEDEPAVRDEGDLGWGAHEWATARRAPWHAAAWLAQREVRLSHPKTTMEFPHGDEGDRMVGHLLRYAGYPEHRLGGAFAVPHRHPERGNSNPAWDADGFPGVALHPDRWDYGTAAHEASHHVVLYNNGRGPNTPQTDEQVHGPEWAGHYAMALNKISRNAGDDFLYHHQRFHDMIQAGLGRQDPAALDAAEQRLPASRWIREGAADEAPATTVRMVPPAEYGKYEYPDYPVKTLPALARHFRRTNPAYWQALHDDITANGVQAPVLARFQMGGRPLRRPRMMDGHNRAAVAYELGLHIPVGDYDNQADYDAAAPHGREWFGQHQELKAQGKPPWRAEASAPSAASSGVEHWPVDEVGKLQSADYHGRTVEDTYQESGRGLLEDPGYQWKLRTSIDSEGLKTPVEVRGGTLLNGHNRYWVARDKGLSTIPVRRVRRASDQEPESRWWNPRLAVTGYDGLTGRSAMIYLDLPGGSVRHVKGGVDDHHITIVYLGKNVSDKDFAEACRRAREAAARTPPLAGFISGIDTFEPSGSSDGKVPAFVPAYLPGVGELRRRLEDLSGSEHRQYRPHVTLGYFGEGEDLPEGHPTVPVSFDRLHVKRGDDVTSFLLGGREGVAPVRKAAAARDGSFYHGSYHEIPPGAEVTPEGANEAGRRYLGSGDKHVFYTDDPGLARTYGPHVYRVEPLAPPSGRGRDRKRLHDPEPGFPREYEYLSSRGVRVVEKVGEDEASQAMADRTSRRWKSRGGQETIRRIIERGDELPPSAVPHYKPARGQATASAREPARFYHGSGKKYRDGDLIDPAEPHKKIHPQSDPSQVYFSDSPWNAQRWGDVASRSGQGYAYEVEPTGDHEEDPHYSGDEERGCYDLSASPPRRVDVRRTGAPLRVIRRLPRQD